MYYSPVRRSARGLARLACVKPTANVHSEPGSNSQLDVSSSKGSSKPDRSLTAPPFLYRGKAAGENPHGIAFDSISICLLDYVVLKLAFAVANTELTEPILLQFAIGSVYRPTG